MAVRWKGGAVAVAQVNTFAFAGTWEIGDLIRVTIGSKVWDYAVTSATITTFLPLFVTAWLSLDDEDYPEFAEITPTSNSTTLTLTAATPGKPFTATLTPLESNGGAADAQTIEGAGDPTTGTAATASSGPNDWSTALNWDTGAVPVDSDDVIIDLGEFSIWYGLSQSSIDPASLKVLVQDDADWTMGLPEINRDAEPYVEYRTRSLTLNSVPSLEVRTTSSRVKINTGTAAACTANVLETGTGADGIPALLLTGAHAANVTNISGTSEVGIAFLGGETATLPTLRLEGSCTVVCGAGVTLTTATVLGGSLETRSALTTLTIREGSVLHRSGAVTTANVLGGSLDYRSSGTIGTLVVGTGGSVDFDQDPQARTVSACDVYAGASIDASNATVTWSAGIDLNYCTIADVSLSLYANIRVTPGTPA